MNSVPAIDELVTTVTDTVGVMQSATVLINGFQGRLDAAVAAAMANGATAEQLKPLTGLSDALKTNDAALAAAIAANSPPPANP